MSENKPDWSAIGRKSKNKGHAGERRLAKLLTELTGVSFRKIPGSGGFNKSGGAVVAEHKFCGDVVCDSPRFAFCTEAKNRPDDFNLAALTTIPESADFTQWWYQVNAEANYVKLLPLLYFKLGKSTNNFVKNDYLAMTERVAYYLGLSDVPHCVVNAYREPVWVTIRVKVNGSRKKQQAKVKVKLPNCWLISWIVFAKNVIKDNLFSLPEWVLEENNRFQIEDKQGPEGTIWPDEVMA